MVAMLVRITVDISRKGLELGMYVQEGQVRDGSYSGRCPQLGCWGLALLAGVLAHSRLHTVLVCVNTPCSGRGPHRLWPSVRHSRREEGGSGGTPGEGAGGQATFKPLWAVSGCPA